MSRFPKNKKVFLYRKENTDLYLLQILIKTPLMCFINCKYIIKEKWQPVKHFCEKRSWKEYMPSSLYGNFRTNAFAHCNYFNHSLY